MYRTCPRSLRDGQSGSRTHDPPVESNRLNQGANTSHNRHYLKKYACKLLGFARGLCSCKTLAKELGSQELQYDRKQMVRGGRLKEAKHVQSFLEEDLNRRMCPGKKDHKRTIQKRILLFSMKDLRTKYTKEHSSKISYSTFQRLRPVWIVEPSVTDREACACLKDGNIQFVVSCIS